MIRKYDFVAAAVSIPALIVALIIGAIASMLQDIVVGGDGGLIPVLLGKGLPYAQKSISNQIVHMFVSGYVALVLIRITVKKSSPEVIFYLLSCVIGSISALSLVYSLLKSGIDYSLIRDAIGAACLIGGFYAGAGQGK